MYSRTHQLSAKDYLHI